MPPPAFRCCMVGRYECTSGCILSARTGRRSSSTFSCTPILCACSTRWAYTACLLSSSPRACPAYFRYWSKLSRLHCANFERISAMSFFKAAACCLNHRGWYVACRAMASSSSSCSRILCRSPSLNWNAVGLRATDRLRSNAFNSNVSLVYLGARGSVGFRVVSFVLMNRAIFFEMTLSR